MDDGRRGLLVVVSVSQIAGRWHAASVPAIPTHGSCTQIHVVLSLLATVHTPVAPSFMLIIPSFSVVTIRYLFLFCHHLSSHKYNIYSLYVICSSKIMKTIISFLEAAIAIGVLCLLDSSNPFHNKKSGFFSSLNNSIDKKDLTIILVLNHSKDARFFLTIIF